MVASPPNTTTTSSPVANNVVTQTHTGTGKDPATLHVQCADSALTMRCTMRNVTVTTIVAEQKVVVSSRAPATTRGKRRFAGALVFPTFRHRCCVADVPVVVVDVVDDNGGVGDRQECAERVSLPSRCLSVCLSVCLSASLSLFPSRSPSLPTTVTPPHLRPRSSKLSAVLAHLSRRVHGTIRDHSRGGRR